MIQKGQPFTEKWQHYINIILHEEGEPNLAEWEMRPCAEVFDGNYVPVPDDYDGDKVLWPVKRVLRRGESVEVPVFDYVHHMDALCRKRDGAIERGAVAGATIRRADGEMGPTIFYSWVIYDNRGSYRGEWLGDERSALALALALYYTGKRSPEEL